MTRSRIDWDAQPFGQESDTQIAKRLGVTGQAVSQQRRRRGIANPFDKANDIDWNVQPFGQETDSEIAKRLGVTRQTVGAHRRRLGIPGSIRRLRWQYVEDGLGKVSDAAVARALKCKRGVVWHYREAHGIPPAPRSAWRKPRHVKGVDWDQVETLGKVPDAELAVQLGVSEHSVHRARRVRGIPPFTAKYRHRARREPQVLQHVVLQHLSFTVPVQFNDLHARVAIEYGTVTINLLRSAVRALTRQQLIHRPNDLGLLRK